ncbi:MAG: EAL domain-containing protein [Thermoleophilaceae bacterium]|nr:EAL domain-containing protein [Thermoleophilaceae bacterium]
MSEGDAAGILLVDDRPENALALEGILAPLGQDLVRADSGEQALKQLLRRDFALILLDVQMPGLDGFETARHIKLRERSRHIPIIFMTANDREEEDALRGYSVGAADYIRQPFHPDILRSKVSVFLELHRLKREADSLAHRAMHDSLTGLPNRVLFVDRLEMALAGLARRSYQVAVLFLDLDGFKLVNDRLGHEAGDELLKEIARRLSQVMRPSDTVARFGGDEFTVLAEGYTSEAQVVATAERIRNALCGPFVLEAGEVTIGTSIGIALATGAGTDAEPLIREADAAMYRAKRAGGSRHELYDVAMRRRAAMRLRTESALHQAIEREEFRVFYQPKVEISTGEIFGVEALVRWQHPDRGLLGPGEFIALAEETSLIVPLGAWVLREALRQGREWRSRHAAAARLTMAVNLSAHQLARGDLCDVVSDSLEQAGVDPALLCLEITESVAMEEAEATIAALRRLRDLGVRLAIDDFGSGYSSLSYLRSFPVDILKIDRSFVQGLGRDRRNASIAGAIVSLAHALDLTAIAEGVETEAQLAELRGLGCDVAQGFLFARPAAPEELEDVIAAGRLGQVSSSTGTSSISR